MADLTHLDGRVAVDGEARPLVPPHVQAWHEAWTAELARLAEEGEKGPVLAYLHELRYDMVGVDPWLLLELAADRTLNRAAGAGEAAPALQVPGAQPGAG
jgi:hypothetical protein